MSGEGSPREDLGGRRKTASLSLEDEARLLLAVRGQDRRAFEALYRHYHPQLSRFIGAMIHRAPLVEEVLNDTMMVVWRQVDRFRGDSRFSTWLFGIAYRKALKARRREDLPVEDPAAEARPSDDPGPDQPLQRRQQQQQLQNAIAKLSPEQRAVIDLTYFQEMAYLEIADVMDCPVGTVKTRVFHARRRLRLILADEADVRP